MRNKTTFFMLALLCAMLAVPQSAKADEELVAVTTEQTWDFTTMSFSSSALETAQYLQDNTIYLGPGVFKNGRAAFTTKLDNMPTALGDNMVAFKAGANGQCLIMVSTYRGYVHVSDGTSIVADYSATGDTYHDGGMTYYRHVFSVESGKTYYIYTTNIASLNNNKSDVGVIKMDYRPTGVNSTTAFSSTEVVKVNVNANFPRITFQGITYDNVYVGQGVVYTNSRHTFGGATSGDTKNPTTYAFSFKLPAGKGSLYIDPSSYDASNSYVKLSNGEEILLHMGKTAHHAESGDAAIAARTYAYESSTETTMYVYSTASGDGYGLYGITWTPTTHTYTINAVDNSGNLLQQLASATCIEGGSYSLVGVPKVVSKDGKYYVLNDANVTGYTTPDYIMGSENEVKTITYTEDASIVYFAEMENLNNIEGTGTGDYSGGKYAETISGKAATLTTLGTGFYTITGCWRNNGSGNRGLYLRNSTSNTAENVLTSMGSGGQNWSGEHTSNFSLNASTTLYLTGYTGTTGSNPSLNKSASLDYIIIRTIAEVSTAGFATYVSSKALDYTDTSIKAYTAQVTGGNVVLKQINKVPANTPVLLYKDGGATENIPVTTETDAVGTNELVAGTGDAVATIDGEYTNYILNNVNVSGIGFYRANGQTVATNRAYLHTLTTNISAARMAIIFDDDPTGINTVNSEEGMANDYYDLQGRKITSPAKGLYIVNGKKVIVK